MNTEITLASAREIGEVAQRSRIMGVSNVDAATAIILVGAELGLSPMQSLRSMHIIDGKPSMSAALIVAVCVRRADICKYFSLVESTPTRATYKTHRDGAPDPVVMSYSIEDAKTAGLSGRGTWAKHPAAMLRARCQSALARAVYPDLVMGLYDPDEVEDFAPTAAPAPQPAPVVTVEAEDADFDEVTEDSLRQEIEAATTAEEVKRLGKVCANRGYQGAREEAARRYRELTQSERNARVAAERQLRDAAQTAVEVLGGDVKF